MKKETRNKNRTYYVWMVLIAILIGISGKPDANTFSESFTISQNHITEIAFTSDTQAPIWVEKLFIKGNHNLKATELIFQDIVTRHPIGLFITGDVVSLSYQNRKWKNMDTYLANCRNNGIPVYAILGNHELMVNSKKGERNFQTRFPEHNCTGYVKVLDSIAIVMVNSNFDKLTETQINNQDKWYDETLNTLDKDPAIQFAVVACHHSPFSNSTVVGSSKEVQQKFVPLFLKSKKGKLFLSGHSHAFEHFKFEDKDFVVIGGGGGLHQPLNRNDDKIPSISPLYNPNFHYLTIQKNNGYLKVVSQQLKDDFSGFEEGLTFNIPKP